MAEDFVVWRPVPGVTVARFAGERPLMRVIPEHFGTTLHLSGRSEWAGGRWSEPGMITVKLPGEVAVERSRRGRLAFQTVVFDAALVEAALAVLDRPAYAPVHALDRRDPRAAPVFALHRQLLADEPIGSIEDAVLAFAAVMHGDRDAAPRRFTAAVARARALLDERFTETISLEELAAHARLDKFRLCRAFREQIGVPPHAYVTLRRIARAQDLLARGVPPAEVAVRVGFYDQSLMHRHFKRIVRITPGAYVRASRAEPVAERPRLAGSGRQPGSGLQRPANAR
jgi:AraC-like DNA-binding protein